MGSEPGAVEPPTATAEDLTGQRIAAALIDLILLALLGAVMSAIFGAASSSDEGVTHVSLNLSGGPFILYVLLCFAYSIVLEAMTGQTIGKKLTGLRVVSVDGAALKPPGAVVRNLLRLVDGFPYVLPYFAGFICVLISKKRQRLGDLAAGTVVVRA